VKAIKQLKAEGINVTATAVYDLMQAYMALAAGADYIAPYVNRIGNLGNDPMELINELSNRIVQDGYDCKILAASFKGVQQVRDAFNYGSQAITAPVEVLKQIFANPSIEKAVNDFNSDWYDVYGEGKGICDL
ncbi:fructose-bisphosphate aldolase, partial [Coprobacillus sp. AF19-3]